jgi:ATP-dependent RNA helicase DDX51/DBP6
VASTPTEKPLVLLHLLHQCHFKQTLCFTNSVETTHRLFKLLQLFGDLGVAELSSHLHPEKRKKILRKFAAGKIQVYVHVVSLDK